MRERCLWAVVVCLLVAAAPVGLRGGAGDEASEARAVIERAVKAAGGDTKLAARKALTLKARVKIRAGDMEGSFSGDLSLSELDKCRWEGDWVGAAVLAVINPDGCWRLFAGQVEEARPEGVRSLRKLLYALRAGQMLCPLKDKDVTLSHGGEGQAASRPAVIVKVAHKDHGFVDLYFDKETGLPSKIEINVIWGPDNRERPFECLLSDYQDFEGAKHFTKVTFTTEVEVDTKLTFEVTLSEVKTPAKLGDELFAKPQ